MLTNLTAQRNGRRRIRADEREARGGGTTIYFPIKALKPAFKKAVSLGAKETVPPMTLLDGHGHIAVFQDSQNALIGLFSEKME